MFAFADMLVPAAEKAEIKVPEDPDKYDPNVYPYWFVFCTLQLGRRMPYPGVYWENAKVVASIPKAKIKQVTPSQVFELGFE